jgi:adenylate cyclase
VLEGSITRGKSTSIEAVLWFSDLRGYTSICDRVQPNEIIPFLNDYAESVISAIHGEGGDVLKLIGDGTLAMFAGEDRTAGCRAALAAAHKAFGQIEELKQRRTASGLPATDLYLGLHLGEVVYGNFGSRANVCVLRYGYFSGANSLSRASRNGAARAISNFAPTPFISPHRSNMTRFQ